MEKAQFSNATGKTQQGKKNPERKKALLVKTSTLYYIKPHTTQNNLKTDKYTAQYIIIGKNRCDIKVIVGVDDNQD